MIEIIKRGTKNITTCKQCGCKFSYESEDIQQKFSFVDIYKQYKDYVICPQCNEEVVVSQTR